MTKDQSELAQRDTKQDAGAISTHHDDGGITNYVPESDIGSVRLSRWSARSLFLAFVLAPAACVFIYMYSQYRVQKAQSDATVKETQIRLMEEQHGAILAAREEVYEAKLETERQKGMYADYVQPWVDWFRGSDVSVDAGPVSVEIKPGD